MFHSTIIEASEIKMWTKEDSVANWHCTLNTDEASQYDGVESDSNDNHNAISEQSGADNHNKTTTITSSKLLVMLDNFLPSNKKYNFHGSTSVLQKNGYLCKYCKLPIHVQYAQRVLARNHLCPTSIKLRKCRRIFL